MNKLSRILIAGILISGCSDKLGTEYPHQASDSYVLYYGHDALCVEQHQGGTLGIEMENSAWPDYYSQFSEGSELEAFNRLRTKHKDVSYPYDIVPVNTYNTCYYKDFKSLDIYCDEDINAEHPAGSLLNDIFMYTTRSVYDYISNGYTGDTIKWIDKRVSMLTPEDMTLLPVGTLFYLTLDRSVKVEDGEYNISLLLTTDEDEVIRLAVKMTL